MACSEVKLRHPSWMMMLMSCFGFFFFLLFSNVLKQVSIYLGCLAPRCDAVLLRTSKYVLRSTKLNPALHPHEGKLRIMTEFSFLGELILLKCCLVHFYDRMHLSKKHDGGFLNATCWIHRMFSGARGCRGPLHGACDRQ